MRIIPIVKFCNLIVKQNKRLAKILHENKFMIDGEGYVYDEVKEE